MTMVSAKEVIAIKKVYIIILNYNGYKDTIECLKSLKNLQYPNYSIVVCDNASPNGSEGFIRQWMEKNKDLDVHFIQTGNNLGFAGGNNIGIRYALSNQVDYCWLLNNDTVVQSDALSKMVRKIEESDEYGVCGSKLISYDDRKTCIGICGWHSNVTGRSRHILDEKDFSPSNFDYVIGASMLIKRKVFEQVGLLQEDYFLYCEEIDFAERIKDKFKNCVALNSIVYHKEGATIGGGSPFSCFYLYKNNLKFAWRFHRYLFPINFIAFIYRIFRPDVKKPFSRMKMFYKVTKSLWHDIIYDMQAPPRL